MRIPLPPQEYILFMPHRPADIAVQHCVGLCVALALASLVAAVLHGPAFLQMAGPVMALAAFLLLFICSLLHLLHTLATLPAEQSSLRIWPGLMLQQAKSRAFWADYVAPTGIVVTILFLFAGLKQLIPLLQPYYADAMLMAADRWVHSGQLPHEYLQPWLTPAWLEGLDIVYPTLFPVTLAFYIYYARQKQLPAARYAFMVGFCLCWLLLGLGGGTLLASMGPCFYHIALPDAANPYASLMEWISRTGPQLESPLMQAYLLKLYQTGEAGFGGGISAMPSVHAALPTLMVWAGWQRSPWLGLLMLAYLALIGLATVALGWHYAVDIYASIIATSLLWLALKQYYGYRMKA